MHLLRISRPRRILGLSALTFAVLTGAASAQNTQHYTQTNLTSNMSSLAPVSDSNLINPWGLSRSSGGPRWVSDNGTGLATLYDGTGTAKSLVVTIPPADPSTKTGSPTGTIFNGSSGFQVMGKPSIFLFVTEDGTVSGWNPGVNLHKAVIAVNEKGKASFKGATIATANTHWGPQSLLYAADFRGARVQVFNSSFQRMGEIEERFQHHENENEGGDDDNGIPEGYAPFNVQNIAGDLYVTYAKQDNTKLNEVDGAGLGFVMVYNAEGKRLHRLEHGDYLNAPWGVTLASSDFGAYSHDVLVGQFGSGEILAFDPADGHYLGKLVGGNNQAIQISGVWGLSFGNGLGAGSATSLYFAAGINGEQGGLFGKITPVENVQGNDQ